MIADILKRVAHIDQLIRLQNTGNPRTLAKKIGVAERSIYEYLNLMKNQGAPIKYDNDIGSYRYEKEGLFNVFFIEQINSSKKAKA